MDLLLTTLVFILVLALASVLLARGGKRADQAAAEELLRQITGSNPDIAEPLVVTSRSRHDSGILAAFYRLNLLRRLEETTMQAGLSLHISEVLLIQLLLFGAGYGLSQRMWSDSELAVPAGCGLAMLPVFYIRLRRRRRLRAFALQLPFALDLIKSSLEAGHSLVRGLQVVVQEFADPLGSEFRRVVERGRLGMTVPHALEELLRRVPDDDLRLLVVAVKVQSEVGSSLATIIGRLSEIVRTRQRLHAQIHAMTAQSRMSGIIVGLLPVAVLGAFSLIQPSYTQVLFHDPMGVLAVKAVIVLDVMALLTIRRILRIDY
jgi:tight adherence protein B